VSQDTAKTRSTKQTSAPDFYKVDEGIVSAAKTRPPLSRHLRRTGPQVFSYHRDRVHPIALSPPNPFRRAWRAGGVHGSDTRALLDHWAVVLQVN
jgi:hypothetical protein